MSISLCLFANVCSLKYMPLVIRVVQQIPIIRQLNIDSTVDTLEDKSLLQYKYAAVMILAGRQK